MTTDTAVNLHLNPAEISHRWNPDDDRSHAYGTLRFGDSLNGVTVFIHTPAEIDQVIAELVALRNEMAPPVITCSERTCDAKHPETGDWCVIEGEHTEHRDTYGETWGVREGGVLFPAGDEDEDERVPAPTGLCGHTVTPGAWSQGYAVCRDCLSDTTPAAVALYDRATAGEQLPTAVKA